MAPLPQTFLTLATMKSRTTFQPRTVGLLVTVLLAAVLSSCGFEVCRGQVVQKNYERYRPMPYTSEKHLIQVSGRIGDSMVREWRVAHKEFWLTVQVGDTVSFKDCR